LIWPQEGGEKPRTMVGVRIDGKIRVEYRSDLGRQAMGDIMVLDITTETGRKLRIVKKGETRTFDRLEWQTGTIS
jgi:hypothetical protein